MSSETVLAIVLLLVGLGFTVTKWELNWYNMWFFIAAGVVLLIHKYKRRQGVLKPKKKFKLVGKPNYLHHAMGFYARIHYDYDTRMLDLRQFVFRVTYADSHGSLLF